MSRVETGFTPDQSELMNYKKLHKKGLDGKGVNIGVFEAGLDEKPDRGLYTHMVRTANVIGDKDYGAAPAAKIVTMYGQMDEPKPLKDTKEGLDNYITDAATLSLKATAKQFRQLADKNPNDLRVVNVSGGGSRRDISESLVGMLNANEKGAKGFKKAIFGDENVDIPTASKANQTKYLQQVVDYVDTTLDNSKDFASALKEYQGATKAAADKNIVPVVSVGNQNTDLDDLGVKLRPDSGFNFQAMSDDVIAVGAGNNNKTPGQYDDDKVSPFSTQGNKNYKPTVLAQGNNYPTVLRFDRRPALTEDRDGTSYAAPQVAATVSMMMQKNPKLTFAQAKQLLQKSAYPIKDVSDTLQGAGLLNPEKAVELAEKP